MRKDAYQAYLKALETKPPGGREEMIWMPFPFPRLGSDTTSSQVLFLFFAMDHQVRNYPEAEEEAGGWFPCSVQDVGWLFTAPKAERVIKQLEGFGLLEREVRGKPPTRFLRVNYDLVLTKCVERWEEERKNRPTSSAGSTSPRKFSS